MNDPFLDKGLPFNEGSEQATLGAILLDNALCEQAALLLRREDFYLDSHRRIFAKMVKLHSAGAPIDLVTLKDELRESDEFERVGGATYIGSLIDGVPRSDTLEPYARKIKEAAMRRAIINTSKDTMMRALDTDDPLDVREGAIKALSSLDGLARKSRFNLIPASDLDQLPEAEFFEGTHIVKHGVQMWVGLSGTFKSLYAMRLAYSIATRGPVVYVSAEGIGGLRKRRNAIVQHYKIEPKVDFVVEPVNLLNDSEVFQFIADCKAKYPDGVLLSIFDTKSQCSAGGNENSVEDDSLVASNANRVKRELDCSVLLIHHSDKADTTGRGSYATFNDCDVVLYFKRDDDLVTISCQLPRGKVRDFEPWPDEVFRIIHAADSVVLVDSNEVAGEYATSLTANQTKVLEALGLSVFDDKPATITDLIGLTGIKKRTLYRVLSAVKNDGLVCQNPRDKGWSLTPKGRALVPRVSKVNETAKSNTATVK